MKTKRNYLFSFLTTGAIIGILLSGSCKKENPVEIPTLGNLIISEIIASSAVITGSIEYDGGTALIDLGIVWNTTGNPSLESHEGKSSASLNEGVFTITLTELSPGTDYYVRGYATNSEGTAYSDQFMFTTQGELATVTTAGITEITATSAVSGGEVADEGGLEVTVRGVVWSTSENPDTDDNEGVREDGSGPGIFTSVITGLSPETTYYVRAYATNSAGTAYGEQESFETKEEEVITYSLTLSVSPSGSGDVTGTGYYHEGEEVEINANAHDGYEFVNWTGDTEYISHVDAAITTVTMPGSNISLTANFDDDSGNGNGLIGEPCPDMPTFTDPRDGTVYTTVQIGNQCWMKENLKYLPEVSPSSAGSGTDPHYYVYDYQGTDVSEAIATDNYQNYGVLYNWSAAMNGEASSNANPSGVQGACPAGWHLPSDGEWTELVDYVVSQGYPNERSNPKGAGNALKSCRQVNSPLGGDCATSEHPRWDSDDTHYGTDQFGFSALPGGARYDIGTFSRIGTRGVSWYSTERSSSRAWYRGVAGDFGDVYLYRHSKDFGFSVRCVRD